MQLLATDTPIPTGALVWDNTTDPSEHAAAVVAAPAIVLQFPKWTDGRAYSQAVLLRNRLRYRGEIRAAGEVVADMAPLLRRCGFDSIVLRADQDPDTARRALGLFAGHYQGDVTGARPRFDTHGVRPS